MDFTYSAYQGLIELLKKENYTVTNYHEYSSFSKDTDIVILRHDIDNSVEKAYSMAQLENALGVKSTYFVLLTSEFYNIAAKKNRELLKKIYGLGHEIGLHFDEASYENSSIDAVVSMAEKEREILQKLLGVSITTVSMHRPSKIVLEQDVQFPSMVNSYGNVFFKKFKYVSDSRMNWRENVEEIIQSHRYHRLHILAHAFSYDKQKSIGTREKLLDFIFHANEERYEWLKENFRDLDEFITVRDVVR